MSENFKEFKERVLNSLVGKIGSLLDEKKRELSRTYFMSEEELSEIKKDTLSDYIKSADDDRVLHTAHYMKQDDESEESKKHFKKIKERGKGISQAVDRLAKGAYEEDDEDDEVEKYGKRK